MGSRRQGSCLQVEQEVTGYLEGALSPQDRRRFQAHCRTCARCHDVLAETRALLGALGRARGSQAAPSAAERDSLLHLFREHGLHRAGPRPRSVPLGLDGAAVAPGDHLAYFWDTDGEFDQAAGFIAAGIGKRETCLLLGHEEANTRLRTTLERGGLDTTALGGKGLLHFLSPEAASGQALLQELGERIKTAVDRGQPLVRILGNLGWGRPGWPADAELIRLEAQVTAAIHNLPAVVMCAYDVRRTPGLPLLRAGLECHPWTVRRGVVRQNEHYVPAEGLFSERDL
ncbi:MAG TPA: MEDS domain-containing protein [Candidatus Polarisedimenticolaceae bacterium]|nr:MEDS domain-containing protein [Candidatus Polarisedimenticolaceae bacterium]